MPPSNSIRGSGMPLSKSIRKSTRPLSKPIRPVITNLDGSGGVLCDHDRPLHLGHARESILDLLLRLQERVPRHAVSERRNQAECATKPGVSCTKYGVPNTPRGSIFKKPW